MFAGLDEAARGTDTPAVSDTPSGDAKAKAPAEDGRARANAGQDRDRGRSRGGRKGKGKGGDAERGDGSRDGDRPRRSDKPRRDRDRDRDRDRRSEAPLTAGLFAGVADREMPCRVAGCPNTWTWFGTQQIRSLGKPPPKRMCAEHLAEFEGIDDKQMPCRNNWCTNTWTWTRAAQLFQRERQDKLKPPHRLCDACFEAEKTTEDTQVPCKIPECKHTWTWDRHAQLRHRAWVGRQQAKLDAEEAEEARKAAGPAEVPAVEAAPASEGAAVEAPEAVEAAPVSEGPASEAASEAPETAEAGEHAESDEHGEAEHDEAKADAGGDEQDKPGRKRRRKRRRQNKRKIHDGPPEKLCERCFARLGHLEPIEVPCKVHGCTSTWTWERDGQLRAWAALDGQENVTELPQPPRRMCNGCFEFVRHHSDREVPCGRPGCDKTWTYKTGAQLQDFLAGRTQDPIRLCDECSHSQFTLRSAGGVAMPEGAEVMPCQVAGCEGSWVYIPGMKLSEADPDSDEPPVDRMCDDCRTQRGVEGRDPRRASAELGGSVGEAEAGSIEAESSESETPTSESGTPTGESETPASE